MFVVCKVLFSQENVYVIWYRTITTDWNWSVFSFLSRVLGVRLVVPLLSQLKKKKLYKKELKKEKQNKTKNNKSKKLKQNKNTKHAGFDPWFLVLQQ